MDSRCFNERLTTCDEKTSEDKLEMLAKFMESSKLALLRSQGYRSKVSLSPNDQEDKKTDDLILNRTEVDGKETEKKQQSSSVSDCSSKLAQTNRNNDQSINDKVNWKTNDLKTTNSKTNNESGDKTKTKPQSESYGTSKSWNLNSQSTGKSAHSSTSHQTSTDKSSVVRQKLSKLPDVRSADSNSARSLSSTIKETIEEINSNEKKIKDLINNVQGEIAVEKKKLEIQNKMSIKSNPDMKFSRLKSRSRSRSPKLHLRSRSRSRRSRSGSSRNQLKRSRSPYQTDHSRTQSGRLQPQKDKMSSKDHIKPLMESKNWVKDPKRSSQNDKGFKTRSPSFGNQSSTIARVGSSRHQGIKQNSTNRRRLRSRSYSRSRSRSLSRNKSRSPDSKRRNTIHSRSGSRNRRSASHRKRSRSLSSSQSFKIDLPSVPREPVRTFDKRASVSPFSRRYAANSSNNFLKEARRGLKSSSLTATPGATPSTKSVSNLSSSHMAKRLLARMTKMNKIVGCDWGERSMDSFDIIKELGDGTPSKVFKAIDRDSSMLVALKKISANDDLNGFSFSTLQELNFLRRCEHSNVARLLEVIQDNNEEAESKRITGTYTFVYEFVSHDIRGLLQSNLVNLTMDNIACLMKQLISAILFCHQNDLVHCNINSSNILVSSRGEVKLSNIGFNRLGKEASVPFPRSNKTDSLWYRAPELLLGAQHVTPAVDMWSCGCVLGEMFTKKPLFPGSDELNQLEKISVICGTPSVLIWPDITQLPLYYLVKTRTPCKRSLSDEFFFLPILARDVLDSLLMLDPAKRATAEQVLDTPWLKPVNISSRTSIALTKAADCHWDPRNVTASESSNSEPVSIQPGQTQSGLVKQSLDPSLHSKDNMNLPENASHGAIRAVPVEAVPGKADSKRFNSSKRVADGSSKPPVSNSELRDGSRNPDQSIIDMAKSDPQKALERLLGQFSNNIVSVPNSNTIPVEDHYNRTDPIEEHYNRTHPIEEHYNRTDPIEEHYNRDNLLEEHHNQTFPIEEYYNRTTPVEEHYNRTVPVKELYNPTAPVEEHYNPTAPVEEHYNPTAPIEEQYNRTTPVEEHYNRTVPVKELYNPTAPVKEHYNPNAPVQEHYNSPAPVKEHYNPIAPVEEHYDRTAHIVEPNNRNAPVEKQYNRTAPADEHYNRTAPAVDQYDDIAPVEDQYNRIAPVKEQYSRIAPVKEQYSRITPVEEQYNRSRTVPFEVQYSREEILKKIEDIDERDDGFWNEMKAYCESHYPLAASEMEEAGSGEMTRCSERKEELPFLPSNRRHEDSLERRESPMFVEKVVVGEEFRRVDSSFKMRENRRSPFHDGSDSRNLDSDRSQNYSPAQEGARNAAESRAWRRYSYQTDFEQPRSQDTAFIKSQLDSNRTDSQVTHPTYDFVNNVDEVDTDSWLYGQTETTPFSIDQSRTVNPASNSTNSSLKKLTGILKKPKV